jgi:hypothetical protein
MAGTLFENLSSNFVKNPLGLIALFIVLVYAIAGIVAASANFSEDQRWVIVFFLVLFPCLVLGVFYRLITKHIDKMYSPGELGAENFVKLHATKAPATAAATRIKAWLERDPKHREQLALWLGKHGISATPTLFLNDAKFASFRDMAITELSIPE